MKNAIISSNFRDINIIFFRFQLPSMCSFEHVIKTCIFKKLQKWWKAWHHHCDITHLACTDTAKIIYQQFVFSSSIKFSEQKVNTFDVMQNNVKYPRNHETFGGWFGPFVDTLSFWYWICVRNDQFRKSQFVSLILPGIVRVVIQCWSVTWCPWIFNWQLRV